MSRSAELLYGRDVERRRLDGVLADPAGGAVVIEGGAGLGKTRLAREAQRIARDRGFLVLGNPPGGRRFEVLGDGAAAHAPASPADLRDRLAGVDTGRRVLVLVEDLHELPVDRVRQVADLARSGRASWVLTVNPDLAPAGIGDLLGVRPVRLAPWPSAVVARVAEDRFGAPPSPELVAVLDQAGGVPRWVTELVGGLAAEQAVAVAGGVARLVSGRVPRRVHEAVHLRLKDLSPDAWQVLRLGAMLGRRGTLRDLAGLIGARTASLAARLHEVLAGGVLDLDGDRLAFRHELVRRVVADSIPPAVRHAVGREIARIRGTASGDAAPRPTEVRAPRGAVAVGSLAGSGKLLEAVELASEMLAQPMPPMSTAKLRGLSAHLLLWRGEPAAAVAAAEQALAVCGTGNSTAEAVTGVRLVARWHRGDRGALTEAEEVLASGGQPDATDVVVANGVLADARWRAGRLAEGLRLSQAAAVDHPWWGAWQRLELVSRLGQVGRFEEADAVLREVAPQLDQLGLGANCGRPPIERARLLVGLGRFREAAEAARAGLSDAKRTGSPMMVRHGLAVLARAAWHEGDLATAVQHVDRANAVARRVAVLPSVACDWMDLRLTAEVHGARAAVQAAETRLAGLVTGTALFVEEPGAAVALIGWARRAGSRELADSALATVEGLAARNPGFGTVAAAAAEARRRHRAGHEHLLRRVPATGRPEKDAGEVYAGKDAGKGDSGQWDRLTDRQRHIAHLAGKGMTNQQIANRVLLSPHTVNYHLRSLYRKLGISSRVELAQLVPRPPGDGPATPDRGQAHYGEWAAGARAPHRGAPASTGTGGGYADH
ncbi:helix-turn-helix transcriptional regulator [Saccharothrix australiensis]|uniref:DNA-binding CsgD family transcriptional regulator n=1 Tax=Saccharothrix australiensis TaxID=2072 RepID=A0A495W0L7_9PSEU|nr:LuxR family transcriptional regulator [Saccharothrix australiensis]RKT55156.1 DNA-binding CsgD family transcriptional regulator [Saccharothrix australiensis]